MGTSKTSRRAVNIGGKGGFIRSNASNRFIPTGSGNFTYVLTPAGGTIHVKVGSAEFVAAVAELRDAEDKHFESELSTLIEQFPAANWSSALAVEVATESEEV